MSFSAIINKLKQYPLAVICLSLLLVFIVIIFLRGGVLDELSIVEADLNSRIRTIKENTKNAVDLEKDVEDLNLIVEQINARLFVRDERALNTDFFYALEKRVNVSDFNATQLAMADEAHDKGGPRELKLHSTIVFNIAFAGSFEETLRFFYELHRVDPLIRIADFQLSGGARGNRLGNLDARLRVIVMAQKD